MRQAVSEQPPPRQPQALALLDDEQRADEVDEALLAELVPHGPGGGVVEAGDVDHELLGEGEAGLLARPEAWRRRPARDSVATRLLVESGGDGLRCARHQLGPQPRSMAMRSRHSSSRTGSTEAHAARQASSNAAATSG